MQKHVPAPATIISPFSSRSQTAPPRLLRAGGVFTLLREFGQFGEEHPRLGAAAGNEEPHHLAPAGIEISWSLTADAKPAWAVGAKPGAKKTIPSRLQESKPVWDR